MGSGPFQEMATSHDKHGDGFFRLVEEQERWPEERCKGLVCLLAKAGIMPSSDDPLEARPVVLLAGLYRLWASIREAELEGWLAAQGVKPLPDPTRSAELYALELAAALEEARLLGEEAGAGGVSTFRKRMIAYR